MKLYDSKQSPAGRIVHIMAHELDMPLETTYLDFTAGDQKKPAFLAINPNGRVPVLQDGEFILWESNAIATYMACLRPEFHLVPTDVKERADMDRWLFWKSCHLHVSFMKVAYETYVKPRYNLGVTDASIVAMGKTEIEEYCAILDGHLAGREFVANNTLSVADFSIAHTFSLRAALELNLEKWKNISRWLGRIEARPSWIATAPSA